MFDGSQDKKNKPGPSWTQPSLETAIPAKLILKTGLAILLGAEQTCHTEHTLPQIRTSLSVQNPPSLPDFEPAVAYRQWCGVDMTAGSYEPTLTWFLGNPKNRQKIRIFLISGEAPLDSHTVRHRKSQVTRFFMRKTHTSRPPALEPLTSCFVSSAPNHSICKLFCVRMRFLS